MKNTIILIIISVMSFAVNAQKKEKKVNCEDYVEVSDDSTKITSDKILLRNYSNFKLRMTLIVRDSVPILYFESLRTAIARRALDLSTDIEIGFIFKDGSEETITFSREQRDGGMEYPFLRSFNESIVSKDLFLKLRDSQMDSIRIVNPYGTVDKSETVVDNFSSSIKKKLKNYPRCFVTKLEELGLLDHLIEV